MIMSFIVIFSVIAAPSSAGSDVAIAPRYRYHSTSCASHLDLARLTRTSLPLLNQKRGEMNMATTRQKALEIAGKMLPPDLVQLLTPENRAAFGAELSDLGLTSIFEP